MSMHIVTEEMSMFRRNEEASPCPKTMSGKHKFIDTSYEVCTTIIDQHASEENGHETKGHNECDKVDRPIKCEYCGMVDDREKE